jgi:hypothetical protein
MDPIDTAASDLPVTQPVDITSLRDRSTLAVDAEEQAREQQ